MDQCEAPPQRTDAENEERAEDERRILKEIRQWSAAAPLEPKPEDVYSLERLSRGFVVRVSEAYELDMHACVDERLRRAPWSWVRGVIGEQKYGGALPAQA
jgi:hypothetical protein